MKKSESKRTLRPFEWSKKNIKSSKTNFAKSIHKMGQGSSSSSTSPPSSRAPRPVKPDPDASLILDGGHLFPSSGLYKKNEQDYSNRIVKQLIKDRKLSPFYIGMDEVDDGISSISTTGGKSNLDAGSSASMIECPICFLYHRII
jgi:hypothetical protein